MSHVLGLRLLCSCVSTRQDPRMQEPRGWRGSGLLTILSRVHCHPYASALWRVRGPKGAHPCHKTVYRMKWVRLLSGSSVPVGPETQRWEDKPPSWQQYLAVGVRKKQSRCLTTGAVVTQVVSLCWPVDSPFPIVPTNARVKQPQAGKKIVPSEMRAGVTPASQPPGLAEMTGEAGRITTASGGGASACWLWPQIHEQWRATIPGSGAPWGWTRPVPWSSCSPNHR